MKVSFTSNLIQSKLSQPNNVPIQNQKGEAPKADAANALPNHNAVVGQDLIVKKDNFIDNLDVVFEKVKGKEGKDFVETAYKEIVKQMGLEDSAPDKITWKKNEGRAIVGDYMFYNNSIVLYTDYFMKMDKATQLGILSHELTHCKQLVNMLTTEGLSLTNIAYAYSVSDARAMLINNPKFQKMFMDAKKNGHEKEFMAKAIQLGTAKTLKELKEGHAKTLTLPKHPISSPEGKKALDDWAAQYNYNGADMKVYNNSPLEKEAYAVEGKVVKAYRRYMSK